MNTAKTKAQVIPYTINFEKLEQSMKHITEQPTEMSMEIVAGTLPLVYTAYKTGLAGEPLEDAIPFIDPIE